MPVLFFGPGLLLETAGVNARMDEDISAGAVEAAAVMTAERN